jgi:hypothetical protein
MFTLDIYSWVLNASWCLVGGGNLAIPWEIQLFTSGRADYYGNVPERNSAAISRFHSVGGSSSLL